MPTMKQILSSKTMMFNIVSALLITLEGMTGMLQPLLPVNFYTAMCIALPLVNAMLRVITTQPLGEK